MRRLQRWFIHLLVKPVRQKRHLVTPVCWYGSGLLAGPPLSVGRCSPGQGHVAYLGLHRHLPVRLGGGLPLSSGGRSVEGSHASPHNCAGAPHSVEGVPALRPSAAKPARAGPHRQQGCYTLGEKFPEGVRRHRPVSKPAA